MNKKSVFAALISIFIMILPQSLKASDIGEPNWVDANSMISYFDGYDLILYDLNMQVIDTIPIMDREAYLVTNRASAWSPDGYLLITWVEATSLQDSVFQSPFQVWDFATRTVIYEMDVRAFDTHGMRFAWKPDSSQFAVKRFVDTKINLDEEIVIYSIENGAVVLSSILSPAFFQFKHMEWGASNHLLAMTTTGLKIWDVSSNTLIADLQDACEYERNPVFSPDGLEFACFSAFSFKEIQIWQTDPTHYERSITLSDNNLGFGWGQNGIVSLYYDNSIRIIDPLNLTISHVQMVQGSENLNRVVSWNRAKTEFLIDSNAGPAGYQIRDGRTGQLISPMITPPSTPTP